MKNKNGGGEPGIVMLRYDDVKAKGDAFCSQRFKYTEVIMGM